MLHTSAAVCVCVCPCEHQVRYRRGLGWLEPLSSRGVDPFRFASLDAVRREDPFMPDLDTNDRERVQASTVVCLTDEGVDRGAAQQLCSDFVDELLFRAELNCQSVHATGGTGHACRAGPQRRDVITKVNCVCPGLFLGENCPIELRVGNDDSAAFAWPPDSFAEPNPERHLDVWTVGGQRPEQADLIEPG